MIIKNYDIKFDLRDNYALDYTCYDEVVEKNSYKLTTRSTGIIIDIGANIGTFSLMASKYADKVISYEPEPHNYRQLLKNIRINKLTNIYANKLAIGKPGIALINDNGGCSQLSIYSGSKCKVISMDDIPFDHCDFMKIDTEGAEDDIINNASDETLNKIDKFVMEIHPGTRKNLGKMGKKLEKFFDLTRYGGLLWGTKK